MLARLLRLQDRRLCKGQWEVQPRAETVTALGQLEVARRAVMEETRAKQKDTAQGLPILSLTLQGGGTTVDTMGNCFVDSCEQVQPRLDKKLTPKTLEANNLRRVMIIGGWSVRQDWEDSYRNWNKNRACDLGASIKFGRSGLSNKGRLAAKM